MSTERAELPGEDDERGWRDRFGEVSAAVRTLALVEVLFAQLIARFAFRQKTTAREAFGMVLVVAGVVLLILAH